MRRVPLSPQRGHRVQQAPQHDAEADVGHTEVLRHQEGTDGNPCLRIVAFAESRSDADGPDFQLLATPLSLATTNLKKPTLEREPGMQCIGYVLRPESEGTITVTSSDPDADADIVPNYFGTPYDREVGTSLCRAIRTLFATEPIASYIDHETQPGAGVADDDDEAMIDAQLTSGYCGYHSVATVAMGTDETSALDPELRVRGVDGLRVVDTSLVPTMVSGNCNAPMMALGWRAADLILDHT